MSDCVPDFHQMEGEADCDIPATSSAAFSRPPKKSPHPGEEDVMELMWQNGPVVVQRASKRPGEPEIRQQNDDHLFMQEDEMASWLQYPLDDFYADILFSNPPPQPPAPKPEVLPRANNFAHFNRIRPRTDQMPTPSVTAPGQSAVVESNVTPDARTDSRVSMPPVNMDSGSTRDLSRKRKDKSEADDSESQSEDIEFEATEGKKEAPGSSSTKRSRAAEVHNLSERRRRDRINEKMKALQELIPRCNKSDKASMLDEAIEYLKSLQMQVQMMSMGYGMMPMMYPGMQQYMPAMGMGMGMGMGMNRPIVPYPPMVQGSGIPGSAAGAHMGPRFPMPAFHMPSVRLPDPSRVQASNQSDPMLNPLVALNSNQPRMPNFVDPYQQYLGLQQAQLPLPQAQLPLPQNTGRTITKDPGTSKETGNPGHQQTGRK